MERPLKGERKMLNDQAVTDALRDTIEHVQQQNLEQAEATLEVLGFERLLRPIEDRSKQRRFVDPAGGFGVERVHETGDHIRSTEGRWRDSVS